MKRIGLVALVFTLAVAFVAVMAGAMLELGPVAIDLRTPVAQQLVNSGVTHPVTAVLLNYRGYDTLLEIAVLLLALLAILAVVGDAPAAPPRAAHPVLQTLARLAAPLMVVVAVYLLWAGAFRPGGAFQAARCWRRLPCCCIWWACCRAGAGLHCACVSAWRLVSRCFWWWRPPC
jgi:multisubunit Na+/H+ antiporter MnhB subunit